MKNFNYPMLFAWLGALALALVIWHEVARGVSEFLGAIK